MSVIIYLVARVSVSKRGNRHCRIGELDGRADGWTDGRVNIQQQHAIFTLVFSVNAEL